MLVSWTSIAIIRVSSYDDQNGLSHFLVLEFPYIISCRISNSRTVVANGTNLRDLCSISGKANVFRSHGIAAGPETEQA